MFTTRNRPGASDSKAATTSVDKDEDEIKYIEDLTRSQHVEFHGNLNSNRRDLLYCMHETSTVEDKQLFRYTQKSRNKKSRRFKKLQKKKKLKPEMYVW